MKRARPLIAALAALVLVAAPAGAKPPIWLAVRGKSRLLLFGSIHLLPPELDWTPSALERAETRIHTLWFEMPIDAASDAAARSGSLAKGVAASGATLFTLLPWAVAEKVRRAAAEVQIAPARLAPLRPWLADVSLTLRADLLAGGSAAAGVERRVQAAVPLSIERRAFETASQQIDFLAEAPVPEQVASLEATADEILERRQIYRTVLREWLAADLDGLRRDALEPLRRASPALFDRLITERNRRWALILGREAPTGLCLIVVGVGHMIGPEGLPELLRRQGFAVTRLPSEGPVTD